MGFDHWNSLLFAFGTGSADQSAGWMPMDTKIVLTAALAAMACTLPGVWLVLRRQSLMGDVLSHTTLPGVVLGFLLAHVLEANGWIPKGSEPALRHTILFAGALATGVLSAILAEAIQHLGRVEAGAALGVVLTTLFAAGLLLIRIAADSVHLDQECILFGSLEQVGLERWVPQPTLAVGAMLLFNLLLTGVFFKELLISAFDPGLATTLGFPARVMHYGLMAVTAATVVSSFESVGSILVIAMLIVPAATAHLLTDRLPVLIVLALGLAAASAVLGHVSAIVVPPVVFGAFGYQNIGAASTSGMMALSCGVLFAAALVFSPRHGLLSKALSRWTLSLSIVSEDILGLLYRAEEARRGEEIPPAETLLTMVHRLRGVSGWLVKHAVRRLVRKGLVASGDNGFRLTETGFQTASRLVRAHRLWESYVSRHFAVPDDHLHATAERVEHFLDPALQAQLAAELQHPRTDPQGKAIP